MLSTSQTLLLAAAMLLALALLAMAAHVLAARRMRMLPAQALLFMLNALLARLWWRGRARGRLNLPADRGAIVVANHRSPVDPSFVYLLTQRVVHWMVAREYCEHWAAGWFFRVAGSIPTNRGGIDTAATKAAIRYAEQGGLVGMFPEGKLNTTDDLLLPGRSGAALIAIRARVPVVPCYIAGSPYRGNVWGAVLVPARVTIHCGEPLDLSEFYDRSNDREALEEATRRILKAIAALAGQPDYVPRVAIRQGLHSQAALDE